jgi:hypothetical protein
VSHAMKVAQPSSVSTSSNRVTSLQSTISLDVSGGRDAGWEVQTRMASRIGAVTAAGNFLPAAANAGASRSINSRRSSVSTQSLGCEAELVAHGFHAPLHDGRGGGRPRCDTANSGVLRRDSNQKKVTSDE